MNGVLAAAYGSIVLFLTYRWSRGLWNLESRAARSIVRVAAAFVGLLALGLILGGIASAVGHPLPRRLIDDGSRAIAWASVVGLLLMVVAVPILGVVEERRRRRHEGSSQPRTVERRK